MTGARAVLLGCGGIGTWAARTLALAAGPGGEIADLVVADLRADAAGALAGGLGVASARSTAVDATDPASIGAVVAGADLVVNCVGPFYRFGPPILEAVVAAGVPRYVDVCDDLDATVAMLDLDGRARDAGTTAVLGMGNSPGLANVLTRFAADHLLDAVESVDIMHIHGGEPEEGGAVIKHRIHAMTNDVPVFVDGVQRMVRMLEPSGEEFVVDTEFRNVGTYPVYPYPHPETITLPRHLPGLRRATNLGVVFPLTYFGLTMDMVRLGLVGTEPIDVGGQAVAPIEFTVAHILHERARLLAEAGVTSAAGCLKIVVAGAKDGEPTTIVFSLSSTSGGAGEGTGVPAGLAGLMLLRGQVDAAGPGVHPPEACIDPTLMLSLAGEVVPKLGIGGGDGDGGVPIHIAVHHADGSVDELPLAL